jgi:hypothetical protein
LQDVVVLKGNTHAQAFDNEQADETMALVTPVGIARYARPKVDENDFTKTNPSISLNFQIAPMFVTSCTMTIEMEVVTYSRPVVTAATAAAFSFKHDDKV